MLACVRGRAAHFILSKALLSTVVPSFFFPGGRTRTRKHIHTHAHMYEHSGMGPQSYQTQFVRYNGSKVNTEGCWTAAHNPRAVSQGFCPDFVRLEIMDAPAEWAVPTRVDRLVVYVCMCACVYVKHYCGRNHCTLMVLNVSP
jgi:hypothetical protein